ncbi:hypothetical protein V6N13_053933 [Hibiscus sabdariffa]
MTQLMSYWTTTIGKFATFILLLKGKGQQSSMDLQDFLLRARVLKLYRQALRTARKAPHDSRAELKQVIRQEMESNRACGDKQKIRFLISEGTERLKGLAEMLGLGIFSLPMSTDDSSSYDLAAYRRMASKRGRGSGYRGEQWTEIISWEPRAFLYHNFLSKEECEYLIKIAKPFMKKSSVVDTKTGKRKDSRFVLSAGYEIKWTVLVFHCIFLSFFMTSKSIEHGEGLQVLHYEVGQKYDPHFDYFLDSFNIRKAGQRMATMLMYLTDVEEGGETVFPNAKGNVSDVPWWDELSECGKRGLAVKPKMGNALLFWSMRPNATVDPSSLHGGCPVIKGDKWSSTKWMHVNEY